MNNLRTFAEEINVAAVAYRMGNFQEIRVWARGQSTILDKNHSPSRVAGYPA